MNSARAAPPSACCWRSAGERGGRDVPHEPLLAPEVLRHAAHGLVVGDRAVHDVLPHDLQVAPRLILAHETTADHHRELAEGERARALPDLAMSSGKRDALSSW